MILVGMCKMKQFIIYSCVYIVFCVCEDTVTTNFTTVDYGDEYSQENSTESSANVSTETYSLELNSNITNNNLSLILKMATPCETPNHDPGYCIHIKECTRLLKQLQNPEARIFLRESSCGPHNQNLQNPKVCCGKYDNYRNVSKNIAEDDKIFPKKCGSQKVVLRGRIIGGEEASLGEYPWMARIIHKNKYGYKTYGCSAFLIHTKYVLTAGHCVHSSFTQIRGSVFSVVLGEHDSDQKIDCSKGGKTCADPLQIAKAEKVIIHPEYDPNSVTHYNDIAIIHLKKGAHFSDYVQPICLQTDPNEIPNKYFLSGWGKTETQESSSIKLKVDLPAFNREQCKTKYLLLQIPLKQSQICAGGEKLKDSCTGDSGGPLMMTPNGTTYYAAGLVSFGIGCGMEGWPGVYTNIPSFIPWIKEKIIENSLVSSRSNFNVKGNRKRKQPKAARNEKP